VLGLLLPAITAQKLTLVAEPYHAVLVQSTEFCLQMRDVHRLSGTIDVDRGGSLSVHSDNGTMPDYTMHVGPRQSNSPRDYVHAVNASYLCKGKRLVVPGGAEILTYLALKESFVEFFFEDPAPPGAPVAVFRHGPNAPLPPPPPPTCSVGGGANQSACDAVPSSGAEPACSWCESKDGVHKLCFYYDHKPDPAAGWVCDR